MTTLWLILGLLLAFLTAPGCVELLLLTIGGAFPARRFRRDPGDGPRRLAVVIPAYNEEQGIADCVASVLACETGDANVSVVVVADNCEDATADKAREASARVMERVDENLRGKGYALTFAFDQLLEEGVEAILVIDGDTRVAPNLIAEFRRAFADGADGAQCRYYAGNPDASLRARLMNVSLMAFNILRSRGRDRWRLSVGLLGNGMGFTRETLLAVPFDATSVVEDLEFHIRLVRERRPVRFVDTTSVWADVPAASGAATEQRARWEGGRFRMMADHAPSLVREVIARGRGRLIEPLFELLLLPLSFHVLLLCLTLAVPCAITRLYAALGLGLVGVHVLVGIAVGGGGLKDIAALLTAPFYIVWKLMIVRALARRSRRDAEWVRTEREQD